MTKAFDVELFLSGVLTGSSATRRRHIRQAKAMQAAIQQRWQRTSPWHWQQKHVNWFLARHLGNHSQATRYYYRLTARLIIERLRRPQSWIYETH